MIARLTFTRSGSKRYLPGLPLRLRLRSPSMRFRALWRRKLRPAARDPPPDGLLPSFLTPLLQAPEQRFVLRNGRANTVIATRIEPAFDSPSRRRGLLGRTEFAEGTAMIIAPCNGIHTLFMRMVIDVVFGSRGGQVPKKYPGLCAWSLRCALRAVPA